MTEKIKCSIVIPTRNSAHELPVLLESTKDFSDVVICDGYSTDATREVAKRYGARVEMQDRRYLREDGSLKDYAAVRNQSTGLAREEWVLNIDAGDHFGDDFSEAVRRVVLSGEVSAYWISRTYVVGGKVIDCASTYPARQIRLYHKRAIEGWVKPMHDRVVLKQGVKAAVLPAKFYTPLDQDVRKLKRKWRRYIAMEAERRTDFSLRLYLRIAWHELLVAGLFFLRLIRVRLFCRGTKISLVHEIARLWYQVALIWALARRINRL